MKVNWSYSCDSKVSFDRMQILIFDFLGRRPPSIHIFFLLSSLLSPPTSPFFFIFVFLLPSLLPSLLLLRKFDSVLSSFFGMRLALRILRPHSYCLIVSYFFLIFLSFFLSLSFFFSLFFFSIFLSLFSFFFRRRIRAKSYI